MSYPWAVDSFVFLLNFFFKQTQNKNLKTVSHNLHKITTIKADSIYHFRLRTSTYIIFISSKLNILKTKQNNPHILKILMPDERTLNCKSACTSSSHSPVTLLLCWAWSLPLCSTYKLKPNLRFRGTKFFYFNETSIDFCSN